MTIASPPYRPPHPSTILYLVPEKPSAIGLTISGDAWWEGQRESIALILHAFYAGKKYVLAGIPTGGGKTLIAAAVQMILAGETGESGGRSLVLTHTKQLQAQYQRTLTEAKVITGRNNFLCDLPEQHPAKILEASGLGGPLTAEDAPCANGNTCDLQLNNRSGCGYYRQWWEAADAPMVVMNYAYAARVIPIVKFKEHREEGDVLIDNPFRRSLLVMDECHLAHDTIVEAAGRKLWMSTMRDCEIKIPPEHTKIAVVEGGPRSSKTVMYENVEYWQQWAKEALEKASSVWNRIGSFAQEQRRLVIEAPSNERLVAIKHYAGNQKSLRAIKLLAEALRTIAGIDDPDEWNIRRDISRNGSVISVTAQPIWGWNVIPQMMLQHFGHVLLMSATPGDPDVTRVMMGIPQDEFVYIERPSTFPVGNRPVFYHPVVKLNYRSTDEEWGRVADVIYKIGATGTNATRKGLVHSGSAANAKRLVELLNARYGWVRAFTHGSGPGDDFSREEALEEFIATGSPRILVTASFTTGLDLPYIIGWQVVAKVPYGNLGDELTSRRRAFKLADGRSFGQTYYESVCMNTVVQAAGRIVRSPQDSGPTFILDANYAMLHARAFKPGFYSEAFRRVTA